MIVSKAISLPFSSPGPEDLMNVDCRLSRLFIVVYFDTDVCPIVIVF